MKVYIDGENLRQRLVTTLYHQKRIHDRDDMFKFNVRQLITEALGEKPEEIIYYTTRIRQPEFEIPDSLQHKLDGIMESHRRWIAELTNQGIRVVKGGTLKVHQSRTCYECGNRTMLLHEKGVDVRLAIDIVQAAIARTTNHIVILSSDSDMIPALEVVKRSGVRTTYLYSEYEMNQQVAKICDNMIPYNENQIIESYSGSYRAEISQRLESLD